MRLTLALLTISASMATASACNVPVFRYALERWKSDPAEVLVFYHQSLTAEQQQKLSLLDLASRENSGTANIRITRLNVNEPLSDAQSMLWNELKKQNVTTPYCVVQSRVAGQTINSSRGTLTELAPKQLLGSPIRDELSRRLIAGDSVVWLVVKSNDAKRHAALMSTLRQQLEKLSNEIPLPEGIGLPGSELFSDVPLLMKFSVLELDPGDTDESFLKELFCGFEPDCLAQGESLVIPVFGRARALEVIPADQLDNDLIRDLTLFLCGACSCQVKERNPGFDLLTSTSWDERLFGDEGTALPPLQLPTATKTEKAVVLNIPPGNDASRNSDQLHDHPTSETPFSDDLSHHASDLSLLMSLLVIVVIALIAARRIDI